MPQRTGRRDDGSPAEAKLVHAALWRCSTARCTALAFVSSGAMSARGWPCTARSFASSESMSCSSSVHGNGGSMSGSSSSCDMAISSWRNPGAVASALVAVFCLAQRRASVRYMETSESGCAGVRHGVAVVTCAQVVRFLMPAPGPPCSRTGWGNAGARCETQSPQERRFSRPGAELRERQPIKVQANPPVAKRSQIPGA
jgi:hypothetical protein